MFPSRSSETCSIHVGQCTDAPPQRSIRSSDGYLGTITSRRGDRILDAVKHREGGRSYVRGVHKGERIDPQDYVWPDEFNPQSGLEAEAMGRRQRPIGVEVNYATPEMVFPARGAFVEQTENPKRQSQLRRLSPSWH